MGKYINTGVAALKLIEHPILGKEMWVPEDYKFYGNDAEREKWEKSRLWAQKVAPGKNQQTVALDAFAGAGVLSLIYVELGFNVLAIEENHILSTALAKNLRKAGIVNNENNLAALPIIASDNPLIRIVDLDGYGSCIAQIQEAARILKSGLLFISICDIFSGSVYGRWSFTKKRYGLDFNGPAEEYAEKVIYRFVQDEFAQQGKVAELVDFFTYKTICRLCVQVN